MVSGLVPDPARERALGPTASGALSLLVSLSPPLGDVCTARRRVFRAAAVVLGGLTNACGAQAPAVDNHIRVNARQNRLGGTSSAAAEHGVPLHQGGQTRARCGLRGTWRQRCPPKDGGQFARSDGSGRVVALAAWDRPTGSPNIRPPAASRKTSGEPKWPRPARGKAARLAGRRQRPSSTRAR